MNQFLNLVCKGLLMKNTSIKICSWNINGIRACVKKGDFFNLDYNWGWKDPRNIFTLPFWITLFPLSKIIIVKRHPYDVCMSLINRNTKLKNRDYRETD